MGFKSLIANQVQGAMRILGTDEDGLARTQTYIAVNEDSAVYDPLTRTVVNAETLHENVPMTLVRFKIEDMDDEVRPRTDRRALIASLDLPVTPTPQDKIKMDTGEVYTVMRLLSDPSAALHIAHLRHSE
jgi:hypothetical protein